MKRELRKIALAFGVPLAAVTLGIAAVFVLWAPGHVEAMSGNPDQPVACTACHLRGSAPRYFARGITYPSPAEMALSRDGNRLYVACEDTDEIAIIGTRGPALAGRFRVGKMPHGLAVSLDGSRLYVSLRGEGRCISLDAESGEEVASVAVGRFPCGLDITPNGKTLVVANSGSDDISIIDAATMTERSRLVAGREPYAVAITEDGARAFIANRMAAVAEFRKVTSAEMTAVDLQRHRVERRHLLASAHLSEGVAASGGVAIVSLCRVRNLLPITQLTQGWVMNSAVGFLSPLDGTLRQFPLDDAGACYADPSGVAIDEGRSRAYVASGGANSVTALDLGRMKALAAECEGDGPGKWADHLGVPSEYVLGRIPVGANPRSLLLSADGSRLYVAEHLSDSVAIVDTDALEVVERVSLGGPGEMTAERRGEMVFHRGSAFQGQFSCRSCHADGHVDGLSYDFLIDGMGRNIVDNRSLLGVAGTEPLKWIGKNKDIHRQCGPRFAMVLTMADPFLEEDLDDLVAYISSLPPAEPRDAAGELTPVQERGRAIFERTHTKDGEEIPPDERCSTCHRPPLYTNRLLTSVKTRMAIDDTDDFDTPHLAGIADSAPYLHDGRAKTLEEIWTVHSPEDTHGVVNDLTKTELNELIEFLKSL